ncbi:2TM domain-containing protein [Winogradskyella endarachnes]|nr:2TM domain-containing protein [Winogradskyella endarachnes]
MNQNEKNKWQYNNAKEKVRKLKLFYLHLIGYFIGSALLLYNLYIVAGPYKNNIISLNLSILFFWTVLIIIHGLIVFKHKHIFKKSWEDKKTEQFLKEKEEKTTYWE